MQKIQYRRRLLIHTLLVVLLVFEGCFCIWLLRIQPLSPFSLFTLNEDSRIQPYGAKLVKDKPYPVRGLPANDERTLINISNFRFTINHNPCKNIAPLLLVLVHSAPGNFPKRDVIRETWGKTQKSNDPEIIVLFMIGSTKIYQSRLLQENKKNMDIIQGNFVDAYKNMTYKHVMVLKWATYYCSSAKYILKVDDDVFVHIPAMVDFLKHGSPAFSSRRFILCNPMTYSPIIRTKSKWYVAPSEFPGEVYYPPYCSGWAILYSPEIVFMLYREAQKAPYFWVDDVHVTGTIALKLNFTRISMHPHVLSYESMRQLLKNSNTNRQKFIFGPPNVNIADIKDQLLSRQSPQQGPRRSNAFTLTGNTQGTQIASMTGTTCQTDYLMIPCATNLGRVVAAGAVQCVNRLCGGTFSAESQNLNSSAVLSTVKQFRLVYHTDSIEAPNDVDNRGFCLNYVQQPCTAKLR